MDDEEQPEAEGDIDLGNGALASGEGAVAVGKEGVYVGGNVGGDVLGAGARKITITTELAYQVHGLPNLYLGLRSYTYEDREAFAGRAPSISQAVERLTDPANPISPLFVTGASGSGKSSFVQAGLLPALETSYARRQRQVRHAIFRPSTAPLAMLGDALDQLGLPATSVEQLAGWTAEDFNNYLAEKTPDNQVSLLVVDQFEECFTQSVQEQRARLFTFLAGIGSFSRTHTHVIATLRTDYLDELFAQSDLWQVAKQGVELRAMTEDELKEAIQQPLQAAGKEDGRYKEKRFEPALLDRLAEDAAQDTTYLPLLQVTLQELWKTGSLVLEGYGQLSDAIRQRAEAVYGFEDYDTSRPEQERSPDNKEEILNIFTDLVEVALEEDPRRDVRRRRLKSDLVGDSIQRSRLVDSLVNARLLSVSGETEAETRVDVVDIIHESLIANWMRLSQAVASKRQNLQRRTRFEQALREWEDNNKGEDYLLGGVHLAEGWELELDGDIALRSEKAQQFLQASKAKAEAAQRRRTRTAWSVALGLAILAGTAVIAAVFAGIQTRQLAVEAATSTARLDAAIKAQGRAETESKRAENLAGERLVQQLILQSGSLLNSRYDQSLLLGIEAFHMADTTETRSNLIQTLRGWPQLIRYIPYSDTPTVITYTPDSKFLVALSENGLIFWDASTGDIIEPTTKAINNTSVLSPDGETGFSVEGHTILFWDLLSDQPPRFLAGQQMAGWPEVVSPDGKIKASRVGEERIELRDVITGNQLGTLLDYDIEHVYRLVFSPDSHILLADGVFVDDLPFAFLMQWDLPPSFSVYLEEYGEIYYNARASKVYFRGDEYSDSLGGVTEILFTPDGKQLAITVQRSSDTTYILGGDELWSNEASLTGIAAKCDQSLVSGWEDGSISELSGFRQPGAVEAIAFSQDCRYMAILGGGVIALWDTSREEKMATPHIDLISENPGPVNSEMATWNNSGAASWANADGSMLVSSECKRRELKFSPMSSCIQSEIDGDYSGFSGIVTSLARSPDGKTLAAGICSEYETGYDNPELCYTSEIWLWPGGPSEGISLGEQEYAVTDLFFSPDGKVLASSSQDGTIRFWDVDIEQILAQACYKAGRNLTVNEWNTFISNDTPSTATCTMRKLDPSRLDLALKELQPLLPTPASTDTPRPTRTPTP